MTLSLDEASMRLARRMLTGRDVVQGQAGVEAGRMLRDCLIRRAKEARLDPVRFMEFVMKDFSPPPDNVPDHLRDILGGIALNKGGTGNRIFKLAPHQKVMTEFMHDHDRSVVILPVGFAKSFGIVGLTLYEMGRNPTMRGLVVSATQDQAKKLISTIRSYIDTSLELNMVFPELRRSPYAGDMWRDDAIVVQRPMGIKDATLAAYGIESKRVNGSRIGWLVADDILTDQNVSTKANRDKVYRLLDNTFLGRLDTTSGSKVLVTNQAWHPDDTLHRMEKHGWPTLRMNVLGDVFVRQDVRNLPSAANGNRDRSWSTDLLRPKHRGAHITRDGLEEMRLAEHDPDPGNEKVLWPQRVPLAFIEYLRTQHLPLAFNRLYMAECRDDESRQCKQEYLDSAIERGRQRGYERFATRYDGAAAFTGVDLAFRKEDQNDFTAFVTFAVEPDGSRLLLDVEYCKVSTYEIVEKIFDKQRRFNSVVVVENNAAQQTIVDIALKQDRSLNIRPHTTTLQSKTHSVYGVQSFFLELANKGWIFPCGRGGAHPKFLTQLMDACLNYEPSTHTDDGLMAIHFARKIAHEWFGVDGPGTGAPSNIGASIMSR